MEISEILDIPVNLVQVRLHRARKNGANACRQIKKEGRYKGVVMEVEGELAKDVVDLDGSPSDGTKYQRQLEGPDSTPRKITSMLLQADTPVGNA
ncbi:hypothetical protein BP422_10355 [Brevibacillus formosus]|uniref:Uncharacterized protein n=1 Tax=Brevibacillus formosus TaxID=54913 RepID=A0A220MFU3_9BACL|nr:hypothetical protein [Brevibacillus formosus]ASJ53907.1 hypothetical protein BP422_10355 [Brevibacillus formosus]